MENNKHRRFFYIAIFFLVIFLVLGAGVSFAQVNTKQLEKETRQKISNYYMEDFRITADQQGRVTVEGDVSSLFDKLKIGNLISQVKGVKGINNKIEVKTLLTADDIIKFNIENELKLNNVILEPEKIKVEVKNGVVILSGPVSYFREKLMTQSIASWQDGVTGMTSSIVVLSPAAARSDDNLKEIVNDILKNHFSLENNVEFDVSDGEVDLYGSVRSLYAKNQIKEEIQHVLGVKKVINEINVNNNLI